MSTQNDAYIVGGKDRLDADRWNRTMRDLGARLTALESLQESYAAAVDAVKTAAIASVNNSLADYAAMLAGAANIGALQVVRSTGSAVVGPGEKTLTVTISQRQFLTNAGYVVAMAAEDPTAIISGVITGFTEVTGELRFLPMEVRGSGTFTDWFVFHAKVVVQGPTGDVPDHEVDGQSIRWRQGDGTWGEWINFLVDEEFGNLSESQIATDVQALAGTNNTKAMTPLRVAEVLADVIPALFADQAEAEAGTADDVLVTPEGVKQYVDARLADQAEAEAGADTAALMTPERTKQAIEALLPGWEQVASVTLSSNAVVFDELPDDASDLRVELHGASHNNGSNTQINIEISNDGGSNWVTIYYATAIGATVALWGAVMYFGYRRDVGHSAGTTTTYTGGAGLYSGPSYQQSYGAKHTGGINAVRVRLLSGTFDAGTAKLLVKK